MKAFATLFLALALATFASAQNTPKMEYGKPAELKGLTKIFVDTSGDIDNRNRIIKEFETARLSDVIMLDGSDNAEVILMFSAGKERRSVARIYNGNGSAGSYGLSTGKGIAFLPKQPNIMRVILSLDDEKTTWFDKKPAQRFAQNFIKLYKEANNIKDK